ncbi:MAG TPA: ribbon-helix-helix domain-containing protein [Myxococcaceae bacterium]|nr:ribbon-helix-helix domain-containing protein [Myxococcaceae bacterium]
MPDSSAVTEAAEAEVVDKDDTVSTHVLVTEEDVRRLRALSRRTRIAQSEYLREAVDDLLRKYDAAPKED